MAARSYREADLEGTPFGRYRLVELLGRGGMGDVWRAYDTVTDRVVAVKVLPAHLANDQTFQERFRREARTWERCSAVARCNRPGPSGSSSRSRRRCSPHTGSAWCTAT